MRDEAAMAPPKWSCISAVRHSRLLGSLSSVLVVPRVVGDPRRGTIVDWLHISGDFIRRVVALVGGVLPYNPSRPPI